MDRHRRSVIKSMIVTVASIVIGKPMVLDRVMGFNDGDDHPNETIAVAGNMTPDKILSKTIDENFKNGEVIDFILIAMILEEKGQLEAVGGYSYLISVANTYDEADFIA